VLSKKGGGTSLFGRRAWNDRFFHLSNGILSYFKSLEALLKGDAAIADFPIDHEVKETMYPHKALNLKPLSFLP